MGTVQAVKAARMLEQPTIILLQKCSFVIFPSNVLTVNVVRGHTNIVHATFGQGRFFNYTYCFKRALAYFTKAPHVRAKNHAKNMLHCC